MVSSLCCAANVRVHGSARARARGVERGLKRGPIFSVSLVAPLISGGRFRSAARSPVDPVAGVNRGHVRRLRAFGNGAPPSEIGPSRSSCQTTGLRRRKSSRCGSVTAQWRAASHGQRATEPVLPLRATARRGLDYCLATRDGMVPADPGVAASRRGDARHGPPPSLVWGPSWALRTGPRGQRTD